MNNAVSGFPYNYDKQANIVSTNKLLQQLAGNNDVYVNIFPLFLNGEQRMDVKYTTDGLHLNDEG